MKDKSLTVPEVAKYLRVGVRKVREAIRHGHLEAIDISLIGLGRRQVRVTPEALKAFEKKIAVKPQVPRRNRKADDIDPRVKRAMADPEIEKYLE